MRTTIVNGITRARYPGLNDVIPAGASNALESQSLWARALQLGRPISNTVTINTGGGSNLSKNIFSFTGPFRLIALLAVMTDVTDIADFKDVGFDVYDGTNIVELSARDAGGVNLDGFANRSILILDAAVAATLGALNADQVRISQSTTKDAYQESYISSKYGVTNYLRLTYDCLTTINVTLLVGMIYVEATVLGFDSGLAAV